VSSWEYLSTISFTLNKNYQIAHNKINTNL
jgi:hypothetical protein